MGLRVLRCAVAAGVISVSTLIVPTSPVQAVTSDPTVIAIHRNGAVDVSGNSSFGTIAKMSVAAGNWSITATATVQATTSVNQVECQLVAGNEFYKARTLPSGQGVASSQAMVLLLAHHFAKTGTVTLKCYSDGWLGDVLIRDVHVVAVKVGQLSDNAGTFGTGSPRAIYSQNASPRGWTNNAFNDVEDVSIPAGTWLVQAVAWGASGNDGDRIDCNLVSTSRTADNFVGDFETVQRGFSMEGVFTFNSPDDVFISCKDNDALWFVLGSAISAVQVGTLKYGQLGGSMTTTGSGSPTVIGGYNDNAGGVSASMPLQSIGSETLGPSSWFATSRLSLLAAATANVTCQLQLGGATDQGRVILDTGNNMINWMDMSLTKKLSASANASVACGQSASTNDVVFLHLKVFALKAGTLTDTTLQ